MKKTKFFPPMNLHRSGERQRTSKQITNVSDQIVVRVMEEKKGDSRAGLGGSREKEETECLQ